MTGEGIGIIIIIGLFFFILAAGIFALCIFTLRRVSNINDYCSKRFDQIDELIKNNTTSTKKLIELLSEPNTLLKK